MRLDEILGLAALAVGVIATVASILWKSDSEQKPNWKSNLAMILTIIAIIILVVIIIYATLRPFFVSHGKIVITGYRVYLFLLAILISVIYIGIAQRK